MTKGSVMKNKVTTPQNCKDHLLTKARIVNFDWSKCQARGFLVSIFGEYINGSGLLRLAQVISEELRIYLDREATRRKTVLYKWFDENLDLIEPFVRSCIVIETRSGRLVGDPEPLSAFLRAKSRATCGIFLPHQRCQKIE